MKVDFNFIAVLFASFFILMTVVYYEEKDKQRTFELKKLELQYKIDSISLKK